MVQHLPYCAGSNFIPIHESAHSTVKRLVDLLGSSLGLLVLLVLFFPIAIAIKLGICFSRLTKKSELEHSESVNV